MYMELCKNGKIITIGTEVLTDANNNTYVQRIQRCILEQEALPIEWIVGICVGLGVLMGVCIFFCVRSQNRPNTTIDTSYVSEPIERLRGLQTKANRCREPDTSTPHQSV